MTIFHHNNFGELDAGASESKKTIKQLETYYPWNRFLS
jgi:hypothetical protein